MPAGAAGGDIDFLYILEFGLADLHLVEEDLSRIERHASHGSLTHRARLLVDLFQHEMLEAALFRHDGVPGDVLHLALDWLAGKIAQLNASSCDHRKVTICEKEDVARVIKDGRNIGGDEVFVFAKPNDCGRSIARRHDLVRLRRADHRDGEDTSQLIHRLADGLFQ